MSKPAREWGPDAKGRWGNKMQECRDRTAEELLSILREVETLEKDIRNGEVTRTRQLMALHDIQKAALLGLMMLQSAGAPVDPVAVSNGSNRR